MLALRPHVVAMSIGAAVVTCMLALAHSPSPHVRVELRPPIVLAAERYRAGAFDDAAQIARAAALASLAERYEELAQAWRVATSPESWAADRYEAACIGAVIDRELGGLFQDPLDEIMQLLGPAAMDTISRRYQTSSISLRVSP